MKESKETFLGYFSALASLVLGWIITRVLIILLAPGSGDAMVLWFFCGFFIRPIFTGILCMILFLIGYSHVKKDKAADKKIPREALFFSGVSILISFLFMFVEPYFY